MSEYALLGVDQNPQTSGWQRRALKKICGYTPLFLSGKLVTSADREHDAQGHTFRS